MQVKKVLARKDAYSVVVAIVLALMLQNMLYTISVLWASRVTSGEENMGFSSITNASDWKSTYLVPILTFVSSFVLLELLLQVYVYLFAKPVKKQK